MLKIGDFARLSYVPVKTLRYYDELGLITPAHVDTFTGYRYYSLEQLPRLNRLIALKDLGLSLEQIGRILNEGISHEQLRGMLTLKRAEIEDRLQEEQERLSRIEARLRDIELENHMPEYDVTLKTTPGQLVAACRVHIPENAMVPMILGEAYEATYAHIRENGGKDLTPCMAVWHTSADTYTDEDAEAVVPIDRELPESERIKVYELPGGTVASAVLHGDFSGFPQLHIALLRWIEMNGYRIVGPTREVYLQHDPNRPDESVTEVQYPVARQG
jgi:DNA-binding transcriptional MerR regulator